MNLRFHFPSAWYELENESYRNYAPEVCRIPAAVMHAIERGEWHSELESFIERFVVIGMPQHYATRD